MNVIARSALRWLQRKALRAMLCKMKIRVVLPQHLRTLAHVGREVALEVAEPITQGSILGVLEAEYPMLRGTIRDQTTQQRRAFIRFFVCGQDWSHEAADAQVPDAVVKGEEPFMVVGAIAGG
jgi:sulfur-carrier protein